MELGFSLTLTATRNWRNVSVVQLCEVVDPACAPSLFVAEDFCNHKCLHSDKVSNRSSAYAVGKSNADVFVESSCGEFRYVRWRRLSRTQLLWQQLFRLCELPYAALVRAHWPLLRKVQMLERAHQRNLLGWIQHDGRTLSWLDHNPTLYDRHDQPQKRHHGGPFPRQRRG